MLKTGIVIAVLLAGAAQAQPPGVALGKGKDHCAVFAADKARGTVKAEPRRLEDMPPAVRIATVYREIDQCPVPVVLGPAAQRER